MSRKPVPISRIALSGLLLAGVLVALLAPTLGALLPPTPAPPTQAASGQLYSPTAQCPPTTPAGSGGQCGNSNPGPDAGYMGSDRDIFAAPAAPPETITETCAAADVPANSFLGGGSDNYVSTEEAGLVAGSFNGITCDAPRSFLGAGNNNVIGNAPAAEAAIVAGQFNTVMGPDSMVGAGGENNAAGTASGVLAGYFNQVTSKGAGVGAGDHNLVDQDFAFIGSGYWNSITTGAPFTSMGTTPNSCGAALAGPQGVSGAGNVYPPCASFIGGGGGNHIETAGSGIGGGNDNRILGTAIAVPGVGTEYVPANFAFIGGGQNNRIQSSDAGILAGIGNTISILRGRPALMSAIGAGRGNTISGAQRSMIGAGQSDSVGADDAAILAGARNNVLGARSVILAGTGNIVFPTAVDSFIGSGARNVARSPSSMVGGGQQNQVLAFATGVGSGLQNAATAGDSVVGGGRSNTVGGSESVIGGGQGNLVTGTSGVLLGGQGNVLTASDGVLGAGMQNTVRGLGATIGAGANNVANGTYSLIEGGCGALTDIYGQRALGSCGFAPDGGTVPAPGTAQSSGFVVRGAIDTTQGGPSSVLLSTDGAGAPLTMRPETTWMFRVNCAAIDTQGDVKSWEITGVAERGTGPITLIQLPITAVTYSEAASLAWDCPVSVDPTTNGLTVTGSATGVVHFVATVTTVEVTY
ncbi:MAG: hypothetical protein ACYDBQ_03140 [Thermoplasmatota archaeon]